MITATRLTEFLTDNEVFQQGSLLTVEPLSGGVSSDICMVSDGRRTVVVKTPLASLKVAGTWTAPLARSGAEADWLEVAARLVPGICPLVLAHDTNEYMLALTYLDPMTHRLWKNELLEGSIDIETAAQVGSRIGTLHRLSAAEPWLAARFANEDLFWALRLDPYFGGVIENHPDLRDTINALIATTLTKAAVLGHGDVSPKNILIGPGGPVFLDAETACWSDPAFDVAFCINHLLLKCLLPTPSSTLLLRAAHTLHTEYLHQVDWEPASEIQRRVARLLPALMLARVDGRSPVEYLTEPARGAVRDFARQWILDPASTLGELTRAWKVVVG